MEAKVLVGGVNLVDQKEIQDLELRRQEAELEEQRRLEREYQQKLQETEESQLRIEGTYSSLQDEANAKTKKLKKLWAILMRHKAEVKDLQDEHRRENEGLLQTVGQLASELQRLTLLAQLFIPDQILHWIECNSKFDPNTGAWILPHQSLRGHSFDPPRVHRHPERLDSKNTLVYTHPLFDSRSNIFPDPLLTLEAFTDKIVTKSKRRNTVTGKSSKEKDYAEDPSVNIPQARGLVNKARHYA
jgi:kinesin family protein 3/17